MHKLLCRRGVTLSCPHCGYATQLVHINRYSKTITYHICWKCDSEMVWYQKEDKVNIYKPGTKFPLYLNHYVKKD